MGNLLIITGSVLCLASIISLILAVAFFGKQRKKLIEQINSEYREA